MHMKFFLQKSSQTVDIMQDVCYYIGRGKVFCSFSVICRMLSRLPAKNEYTERINT